MRQRPMLDHGDVNAHPLAWPVGWQRTHAKARKQARFSSSTRDDGSDSRYRREVTLTEGRERVLDELERLGAEGVVISTDVPVRNDGTLRIVREESIGDPGAAVYFRLRGEARVLACDKWDRLADNLAAIAAHIGALRGIDRWGVGTLDQAFGGYRQLAAVGAARKWWEVLGFTAPPTLGEAEAKWRALMHRHHPDRGGNANQAAEINAAWAQGRKELGP